MNRSKLKPKKSKSKSNKNKKDKKNIITVFDNTPLNLHLCFRTNQASPKIDINNIYKVPELYKLTSSSSLKDVLETIEFVVNEEKIQMIDKKFIFKYGKDCGSVLFGRKEQDLAQSTTSATSSRLVPIDDDEAWKIW